MASGHQSCIRAILLLGLAATGFAQPKRLVVIDQDAAGPGGTDMMAILVLLQSPQVQPLGITVLTGDGWRDEEVAHTLRLLEIVGRTEIPVVAGAAFPLVRTQADTERWEQSFGKIAYKGAWSQPESRHGPFEVPPLQEGAPSHKASAEDAAHFLVRMVHEHPHEVTIYAGGPMTNLALALALDPHFAEMSKALVFMGGSINPQTDDPEYADNPRREFNLWFDPEAAHVVLRAKWPSVVCTTVDVSVKTKLSKTMFDQIARSQSATAKYITKYSKADYSYLWDELTAAAWLDPKLITARRKVYMDVNVDHGAGYGDTLTWSDKSKPLGEMPTVEAQMDVDMPRFAKMFVELMSK